MTWVLDFAALIVGFYLLAKGAHWLVDGGAALARRWGVSALTVGLTVVAWGTSMPEVVVSGLAAADNRPAVALGNVLGSNVANIGLVLGLSAWILPTVLTGRISGRYMLALLAALLGLWFVCHDAQVTRIEAAALLGGFALYNAMLYFAPRDAQTAELESSAEEAEAHSVSNPWTFVIIGSIAIAGAAQLVMYGAERIFLRAGFSEAVVGLTVVAIGTSLPELAAGVGSALKRESDISIGNVIGSNVFNCLAVIGVAGLVRPFEMGGEALADEMGDVLERDFPINLAFAVALIVVPRLAAGRLGRVKGAFLFLSGLGYMAYLLIEDLPS